MRRLQWCGVVAGVLLSAAPAAAQDSQFGIRGLGTPGRWESVRARTTGGAFAAFDAVSGLADVSLTGVLSLTSMAVAASSYRSVETPGSSTSLRTARFPLFTLAGPISSRLVLGGGFGTYLDDSYDVVTRDSAVLRGAMTHWTDENLSDGGVSDLRVAAAFRVGRALAFGLGIHGLTGSTRLTANRVFDDTTVNASVRDTQVVRYTGLGVSASVLITPVRGVSVIGFARSDGHLRAKVDSGGTTRADLPNLFGGAARLALTRAATLAGSVVWRPWADTGPGAYNTLNWSVGLELAGPGGALRLGGRGGQLPYGPGSAPNEWGVAAGFGRSFAGNHGVLDLGIERLVRTGGSLHEAVWTALVGLSVRQ